MKDKANKIIEDTKRWKNKITIIRIVYRQGETEMDEQLNFLYRTKVGYLLIRSG